MSNLKYFFTHNVAVAKGYLIQVKRLVFHCQLPNWDQSMEFLPLKEATSILSLFLESCLTPGDYYWTIFLKWLTSINNRIPLRYKHIVKRSSFKFQVYFLYTWPHMNHYIINFIPLPACGRSSKPNHSGTCIDAFKIPSPGGSVWSLWTHQRLNAVWCTTLSAKRLSGITKTYQGWDQRQFRDILHRFDAWSVPGSWVSLWGCL